MADWSDAEVYEVIRPIPGLKNVLPGDYVVVRRGEQKAALSRVLRFEVVLGATEGPGAALRGPIPFKDPGKDTPKPGRGTWEDEGEQWQGGSFNSDGTMRSEDWKGRQAPPPPPAAPEPEPQQYVHPDTEEHAAGWQAFRQRESLLPHAYHHPAKRWTHMPAPTPAPDFPSLDAWLDAERTGKLTHVPVYEPFSTVVMDSAWHLGIIPHEEVQALSDRLRAARVKRGKNPWPRVCCKCGAEFRPLADERQRKAKRVRCEKCRKRGA